MAGADAFTVLYDDRWTGDNGIARYVREIISRKPGCVTLTGLNGTFPIRDVFSPLRLRRAIRRYRPDVFWSPGPIPPLEKHHPFVITIHDLVYLQHGSIAQRSYYNFVIRSLARRARMIITVSEYSRQRLGAWLSIDETRIVAIPNGVAISFNPGGAAHSIGRPYILYVGNRRRHKNLERLLRAFASSGITDDIVLALSGDPDARCQRITESLGLGGRVKYLGQLDEEILPQVYRGALASVIVSLDEGFGLPAVEAMACGTPLLVSNVAAFPEIVCDAALMVDPYDVDAIGDGLRRLVEDTVLRKKLTASGLMRAEAFSWDAAALGVWTVLQDAVTMDGS